MEMEQMKEQENMYCRDWKKWCYGDRRRRSRIGIFLIIIGALWMGSKLGFFNPAIFWPLAFITIGIWIFVSSVLIDKKSK
jgi:fatty acid desaturase